MWEGVPCDLGGCMSVRCYVEQTSQSGVSESRYDADLDRA